MDERNRKAYLAVIVNTLPTELENKILREAYRPTSLKLHTSLSSTYWKLRQLTKDRDLAEQQKFGEKVFKTQTGEIEGKTHEWEVEITETAAQKALEKFKWDLFFKRAGTGFKELPTGGAWLRGKPKKAMLFLDCACVLRETKQPNIDLLIDAVVEKLEIDPTIVVLVKAYVAGPDDRNQYHKVCADIAALVRPAPKKKKAVVKKVAAKKVVIPLPASGFHKTEFKVRNADTGYGYFINSGGAKRN